MSGHQYPQNPNGTQLNSFMPDRIGGSPELMAQFTAAATAGYHPRPQTKQTTYPSTGSYGVPPTTTSQPVMPNKQMSEFAASFYASGDNGGKTTNLPQTTSPPAILHPPAAQTLPDSFKGLKFVTLDGFQLETREIYDKISGTFQWEMCESQEDRCISVIRDECGDKRVFVITSGGLGFRVVPAIHDLPQVYAIYIYCVDVEGHRKWSSKFPKVRVVCDNDDRDLLPQFAVDVAQANLEWGELLLKQNKRDAAKKKFDKALENLTKYEKNVDPAMITKVKAKLNECK